MQWACESHLAQLLQHNLHDALWQVAVDHRVKSREVCELANNAFESTTSFSAEFITTTIIRLSLRQR